MVDDKILPIAVITPRRDVFVEWCRSNGYRLESRKVVHVDGTQTAQRYHFCESISITPRGHIYEEVETDILIYVHSHTIKGPRPERDFIPDLNYGL